MNDAIQPVASDPQRALLLKNMWVRDVPHVPYADGRPGFARMGYQQGAAKNLIANSELIGSGYGWSLFLATLASDTTTAPDGTTTADTLTGNGATNGGYARCDMGIPANDTYTVGVYLKQGTASATGIDFGNGTGGGGYHLVDVSWSAGVPTVTTVTGASAGTVFSPVSAGSGWYLVRFSVVGVFASNINTIKIYPCRSGAFGGTTIAWGAQVTRGPDPVAYQTTTGGPNAFALTWQRIYQFTKLNGTEYTVGFAGGHLYTYDWSSDAWSEPITTANLTSASITLSTTAKVYCCTFADTLVVSDGVNAPWTWDGTFGGGLTKLTNAPVFYGQPVVYYGKLAGIKNTERNTWVWSEEAAANTGYEAGGYNNAWTLGQTNQEGFYAIAATDTALTFLRREGITQVTGRITTDFQTTGTLDAVSQDVGTVSPAGVMVWENTIYFVGSDRRFYKIEGSSLSETALGGRVTLGGASRPNLGNALVAPWPEGDLVVFGITDDGADHPGRYFALNPRNDELAGLWDGWLCTSLDAVKNGDGVGVLVHGGSANATADPTGTQGGYAYVHGNPDGSTWDDAFTDATTAISHELIPGYLGFDMDLDKVFTRFDASLLTPTDVGTLTLTPYTSQGPGTALTMTSVASGTSLWDVFVWDVDSWAAETGEQHVACGLRSTGRWLKPDLTHSALTERLQVEAVRVRASSLDRRAVLK